MRAWQTYGLCDRRTLSKFAVEARKRLPITNYEHDLDWLLAAGDKAPGDIFLLIDKEGEQLVGMAPFVSAAWRLDYRFAGVRLPSPKTRRLFIEEGPVVSASAPDAAVHGFLGGLAQALRGDAVAFLQAVAIGSPLHAALASGGPAMRSNFFVLPWNPENLRCRIQWDGSVDSYMASIGKETRRDFRRYSQKLAADKDVSCELRRFTSSQDVGDFLRDGIAISAKTYQKKMLGSGLSYGGPVEALARHAAANDKFLGHILYINGAPAAFSYGLIYGKICYMIHTGYDPAWAKRQVGTVLLFQILHDLEASNAPIEILDFLTFATEFKHRTTNDKRRVQDYYLFPRTMRGAFQFATMMAIHRTSRLALELLDRLQLKQRIKRWLRRRATAR